MTIEQAVLEAANSVREDSDENTAKSLVVRDEDNGDYFATTVNQWRNCYSLEAILVIRRPASGM